MSDLAYTATIAGTALALLGALYMSFWLWRDRRRLRSRMNGIPDLDAEKSKLQSDIKGVDKDLVKLRESYGEKHKIFKRLEATLAIYDENLAFAELGVYEPHFDFADS